MARQLVFTSVPQGLTPGRTGYCTVARHRDLRDRLVLLLEGMSIYPSDWQPAPVICTYRLLDLAGSTIPVLTRIVAAGQDYSHRAIFLAHHLVLDPGEANGALSPAEIFMRWPGWQQRWDGPPRWFEETDMVDLRKLPPASQPALPAQTWEAVTNDAGHAALLLDGSKPRAWRLGCDPACEGYLVALFRESSALLEPAQAWQAEFTTFLQSTETARLYKWSGIRMGSPIEAAATDLNALLNLTQPESLPPAPSNAATELARHGGNPPVPVPRPAQGPARAPVTAIPPRLAAAVPLEKIAPPATSDKKPIKFSFPVKKPPSQNKLLLAAGLAALLLLALIICIVLNLRHPSGSSMPGVNQALVAKAAPPPIATSPKPPPPTNQERRDIPPPSHPTLGQSVPAASQTVADVNAPKAGNNFFVALPNQIKLDLVWINPGSFTMGNPASEPNRNKDEGPQTQVTLTKGFWLGKYPVTQEQWGTVTGKNPSNRAHRVPNNPVDQISWDMAMEFCRELTEKERAAGRLPAGYVYTLPTEAQWEYACRAGSAEVMADNLYNMAWFNANSSGSSHSVGQKLPNGWGLYDMHGNVMQWCRDWYAAYPGGSVSDPAGPATGTRHVARGGNYNSGPVDLSAARRTPRAVNAKGATQGLRVALAPATS